MQRRPQLRATRQRRRRRARRRSRRRALRSACCRVSWASSFRATKCASPAYAAPCRIPVLFWAVAYRSALSKALLSFDASARASRHQSRLHSRHHILPGQPAHLRRRRCLQPRWQAALRQDRRRAGRSLAVPHPLSTARAPQRCLCGGCRWTRLSLRCRTAWRGSGASRRAGAQSVRCALHAAAVGASGHG